MKAGVRGATTKVRGKARGIVKLSRIGLTDPQHGLFTTGLEPIILGSA